MPSTGKDLSDLDDRQVLHREVWKRKTSIRPLYRDFHRRLLESCPEGRILDIGSGTAHIKELRADVISTDILAFPGIDVVADAHRLPFSAGYFSGIVMLDVLHHLERPIDFLKEAARLLRPGGRLAMIEPAMTMVARRFYRHCHEEPVEMHVDPFAPVAINANRDPFDANQAIPTLLFATETARARVEASISSLRVQRVDWFSLFAYPMSGGFKNWSLMPSAMVHPILSLEERIPSAIRRKIAFRMMVVLERTNS
jgi:SAM-dependent methyltransferase